MENTEKKPPVPYIVFETTMARQAEGEKRRDIINMVIILTLIVALVGSWLFFFNYESQFEETTITQQVEQDADNGSNRFVGGDYYVSTEDNDNN